VLEPKYKLDVETDSAGSESACALEGPDAPLGYADSQHPDVMVKAYV
jgi:hypothetical protein